MSVQIWRDIQGTLIGERKQLGDGGPGIRMMGDVEAVQGPRYIRVTS